MRVVGFGVMLVMLRRVGLEDRMFLGVYVKNVSILGGNASILC